MKRHSNHPLLLLTLPLVTLVALGTAGTTQEKSTIESARTAAQDKGEDAKQDHESHEKLEAAMKGLKTSQKALRSLIGDVETNQAEILRHLVTMEQHTLAAYPLTPPYPTEKIDETAWQLHRIGFKAGMANMQLTLLRMQASAIRKDAESLKKGYIELNSAKKKGHDTFQVE